MFTSKIILIVEENAYCALDLASAVEFHHGVVAGPVATVEDALAMAATSPFSAAIVDADVPGIARLVDRLEQRDVPCVLQAASRSTPACGKHAVMMYRPIDATMLLSMLSVAIERAVKH